MRLLTAVKPPALRVRYDDVSMLSNILHHVDFKQSQSTKISYNESILSDLCCAHSEFLRDISFDHSSLKGVDLSSVPLIERLRILNPIASTLSELGITATDKQCTKKFFVMGIITCAYSTLFKCHFLGKGIQENEEEFYSYVDDLAQQHPITSKVAKVENFIVRDPEITALIEGARIPGNLLLGNFKQAVLHSCFFKNLKMIGEPENLAIRKIEEGCIFDTVDLPKQTEKDLMDHFAMVNAKINPEFASYYENPKIHENFTETVAKEYILAVARAAGAATIPAVASLCVVQ